MAKGTDLAEQPAAKDMVAPTPELVEQAMTAIMGEGLPPEVGDRSITARAIQERIAASDDFDTVFGSGKLPSLSELAGQTFSVLGFHLNPSTLAENRGKGAYAVVEVATEPDYEIKQYSTGAGNILVQLVKAWEMSWFPVRLRMVVSNTSNGNDVHRLEKV